MSKYGQYTLEVHSLRISIWLPSLDLHVISFHFLLLSIPSRDHLGLLFAPQIISQSSTQKRDAPRNDQMEKAVKWQSTIRKNHKFQGCKDINSSQIVRYVSSSGRHDQEISQTHSFECRICQDCVLHEDPTQHIFC